MNIKRNYHKIKRMIAGVLFCLIPLTGLSKEENIESIKMKAEQGSAEAQYKLGAAYYLGIRGLDKSYEQANKWYQKSALQGNADAQTGLGTIYSFGHGVTKSVEKSLYWYRKSAEQNNILGIYNLAQAYYDGEGVNQSFDESAKLYDKAARLGLPDAQFNLGFMYAMGQGVEKNPILAYFWWEKASENNYEQAGKNLQRLEKMMTPEQLLKAKKLSH